MTTLVRCLQPDVQLYLDELTLVLAERVHQHSDGKMWGPARVRLMILAAAVRQTGVRLVISTESDMPMTLSWCAFGG